MSVTVNTVKIIGDEALAAQIIGRTITEIVDDLATTIGINAFYACKELAKADFMFVTNIEQWAFNECTDLYAFVLRSQNMCTLQNTNALLNTAISQNKGYIYVPRALVDTYKAATNWSTYAAQFRALEDYTVDGTITGELDPTKI